MNDTRFVIKVSNKLDCFICTAIVAHWGRHRLARSICNALARYYTMFLLWALSCWTLE